METGTGILLYTLICLVHGLCIIKSHGNLDPVADCHATLLLLAIIVGCPYHAQDFIRELEVSHHNILEELLKESSLGGLRAWAEKQLDGKPIPRSWRR